MRWEGAFVRRLSDVPCSGFVSSVEEKEQLWCLFPVILATPFQHVVSSGPLFLRSLPTDCSELMRCVAMQKKNQNR